MVFQAVQDQVILAPMGGVIGLNQMAVHEAMRLYGVKDRRRCFEKVMLLAQEVLVGER